MLREVINLLEVLTRSTSVRAGLAARKRIVFLAAEGLPSLEIARCRAGDDQVPVAETVPGLGLNSGRGSGLVRIEGIGICALPGHGSP